MKLCGKCEAEHDTKHHWCRACCREYYKTNRERINLRANEWNKNLRSRLKHLLRATTVDRSKLDFDELYNRLENNNFCCEISGIPFNGEPRNPQALSIDKIDINKPYTNDNVRLVCWWLNAAMGNWGLEKLQELITQWRNNIESKK